MAALNEALGRVKTDSTLTQYLNSSKGSKTNKPKQMGSPMARAIESQLKLEEGWMDNDPDLVSAAAVPMHGWPFDAVDRAKVAHLDTRVLLRLEGAILLAASQLGLDVSQEAAVNQSDTSEGNRKRA
ncbi:hypothetical protein [Variovorax boronicumulans]|nr:hypothetical protein [Variovorax boronicumulans]